MLAISGVRAPAMGVGDEGRWIEGCERVGEPMWGRRGG